jgi:hypothetical protein
MMPGKLKMNAPGQKMAAQLAIKTDPRLFDSFHFASSLPNLRCACLLTIQHHSWKPALVQNMSAVKTLST